MRTRIGLAALLGGLLLAAPSAYAFEETPAGKAGAPAAAQVAPPAEKGTLNLDGTGTSVAPSTGTEIRIPGLGKLGTLPKLDFGLELLYGMNEPNSDSRARPEQSDDNVGVRGTVRHRF